MLPIRVLHVRVRHCDACASMKSVVARLQISNRTRGLQSHLRLSKSDHRKSSRTPATHAALRRPVRITPVNTCMTSAPTIDGLVHPSRLLATCGGAVVLGGSTAPRPCVQESRQVGSLRPGRKRARAVCLADCPTASCCATDTKS